VPEKLDGPLTYSTKFMNWKSPVVLRLMKCGEGGGVETRRMFQAAWAAFIQPARSPTRGSGLGAVMDILTFDVAHAAADSATMANKANRDWDFTERSG